MQAIADLRSAQFAQITVKVFDQVGDIGAFHAGQCGWQCCGLAVRMVVAVRVIVVVVVRMVVAMRMIVIVVVMQ